MTFAAPSREPAAFSGPVDAEAGFTAAADAPAPAPPTVPVKPSKVKPLFRGWSHTIAFVGALVADFFLINAPVKGNQYLAGLVYGGSLTLMFGLSALYHRPMWALHIRSKLRVFDHVGIFALIAGTLTPLAVAVDSPAGAIATDGHPGLWALAVMWLAAVAGAIFVTLWSHAPRQLRSGIYVVIGFLAAPVVFRLPRAVGMTPVVLLLLGAALYMLGAIVYARRWPNPNPRVFGYHEVFHLFVIAAAVAHFFVILQLQWPVS